MKPQHEEPGASGRLPWWTWNDARFALWRPLSSVVLAGIHAVLGRHTAAYHALMVLAYALLIVLVAHLLRRYLPPEVAEATEQRRHDPRRAPEHALEEIAVAFLARRRARAYGATTGTDDPHRRALGVRSHCTLPAKRPA
jgi:hypothetical protein